ncbi:glycosidase PH1107-related protein [Thermobaculum terrenum ATCC BAA-798]|uniref:Glycosidase PH1107-related protein n=1 Tax=Thermobaculum terrenum (strain ATCC BAA-798 / CCMEE 7001 / YNP1) TaxID=525904 RepID=D1CDX0_THET1|nr:glycosidase [Thermobaculum terrenum]ACZ41126.1 glycosidase PH1107-related protein [Thermobaculum terrenum ATCC BAA-798]
MLEEETLFKVERLGIIMSPDPNIPEEVEGVLNPAAVRGRDGELYLFPRVVGRGNYSRVGIARVIFDDDGLPTSVERLGYALEPKEWYELRPEENTGGCEDPRVTYIQAIDMFVMAYTAWGPGGPRIAIAVSEDLFHWERLGLLNFEPDPDPVYLVDFDDYHNKDAAYFPLPVLDPDGKESLAVLHRPVYDEEDVPKTILDPRPSIWVSFCSLEEVRKDLKALQVVRKHKVVIDPEYEWESLRIGGGTVPVMTQFGWMHVYHGVSESGDSTTGRKYCAGLLFLDKEHPEKTIFRTDRPILEPQMDEEKSGVVPHVVFPTGIDDRGNGQYDIYYGMADTRIGVARLTLPERLPAN